MLHLLTDPLRPEYFNITMLCGIAMIVVGMAGVVIHRNDEIQDRLTERRLANAYLALLLGVCVLILGAYGFFVGLIIAIVLGYVIPLIQYLTRR